MMIEATCAMICEVTGATQVVGRADKEIRGVSIDSREIVDGSLFVAFPGERVDGNDFAGAALENGAGCAVMTRQPDEALVARARALDASILVAPDAQGFLGALATWWREQVGAVVIGVTGSTGKTTTRTLIASVLSTEMVTHTASRNYNSLIGCPLTILACPRDAQAMVLEMGMGQLGEIAQLCAIARPDLAVVTNVGFAHIDALGTRENIARAKSEIIEGLRPSAQQGPVRSRVFLWGEDDFEGWMRDRVAAPHGVDVVTYGTEEGDDARAEGITVDDLGRASARLRLPSGAHVDAKIAISGRHNVLNALAAAAVGDALGVSAPDIARGLLDVRALRMHQQVIVTPGGYTVIDDSYNANPASMRCAIDQLVDDTAAQRRVACLGDMEGLGPDAELYHGVVGGYAAGKGVDLLVCVGAKSRRMAEAAHLMGMAPDAVTCADTPQQAAEALRATVRRGDAVLVIASRATGLDAVVSALVQDDAGEGAC
ncbi:MAG: UDP-N-acetylmuramoyl-tripeptide--D-alanyl-D-alanine ligase [Coriobacteriales bacterium]|jgi:UDP-N-acetylmuramoyl-tripeptide--D-alanyl-D-alanine ligase